MSRFRGFIEWKPDKLCLEESSTLPIGLHGCFLKLLFTELAVAGLEKKIGVSECMRLGKVTTPLPYI